MPDKIWLESIRRNDLERMFLWRNDPKIMQWTRQCEPLNFDNHLDWYDRQRLDPNTRMFAVWCAHSGGLEQIGVTGLTSIDWVNSRAEFSLYVNPKAQGRGYGKATLVELFRHGFDRLNLHCIWGETFDGNHAAQMFEKVGMIREGTRRDHYFREGRYINAHLYSIKNSEFWELWGTSSSL